MRSLYIAAATLALFAAPATAECPQPDSSSDPVYLAERTQLTWCWEPVTGGSGSVYYVVESSTNGGDWVVEGETDFPDWTLDRAIGDEVLIRFYACDDLGCSDYSPESRPAVVYPDFDADGTGRVTMRDLGLLRATLTSTRLEWFQAVFNMGLDGDLYF